MAAADQDWDSSSSDWEVPPRTEQDGGGGGGVDMSQFEGKDRYEEHEKLDAQLAGPQVCIEFVLPGGERITESFAHAKTLVMDLKAFLEQAHQVPYERNTLHCGGAKLLDPLSLNDVKELQPGGQPNEVRVELKD
eukprot:TRINITY_DN32909_c0_g1_i1.p2 TRINITY_DN32909_c0_g1~~TRINITY_DN32909_c0_g1_i1.p2  ORF type:complete len:135 (+),score=46.14 TRINITY_DN32909_c0_g1_i1:64-468(+)